MKSIRKICLFLILFVFSIVNVSAATYNASIGSRNLTKGGSTKLTIKGSDLAGRFNITTSNSSVASISEDRVWIDNSSYSITINALNVGTTTITVVPADVSGYNSSADGLKSQSFNVTVSLPREKSSDNNLSNLTIDGYTLTPKFDRDTLDYRVVVDEGTEKINIKAVAASKYSTISGGGEVKLEDGENKFSITVKSETGVNKVYNLVVEVKDQNPINIEVDGKTYSIVKLRSNYTCPDGFVEGETVINEINIPTCKNDKLDYTLVGLKDSEGNVINYIYDVKNKYYSMYSYAYGEDLKIVVLEGKELENATKTKVTIDDKEYVAFKYNDSDRYFIVYGKNIDSGEEGFYLYDKENKTFSSYDKDFINTILNKNSNSNSNKSYLYITITFGICIVILLISLGILNNTKKKLIKKLKSHNLEMIKN